MCQLTVKNRGEREKEVLSIQIWIRILSIQVRFWVLALIFFFFFLVTILLSKHDENYKFTEIFYSHNMDPILPVLRWSCPKLFESLRLETESKSKSLTSESKTKTKQSQVLRPRLVSRPPTLGMEGEGKDVRKGSGEVQMRRKERE